MTLNNIDFVWKENTNLNMLLNIDDKKKVIVIKFSTLMNYFKIPYSDLLLQDKQTIDNSKVEQTTKFFEEELKKKLNDILLFVSRIKISNNSEILLSDIDLNTIFTYSKKQEEIKKQTIEETKQTTKINKKWTVKHVIASLLLAILTLAIFIFIFGYCLNIDAEPICLIESLFNMDTNNTMDILFLVVLLYIPFVQIINIKEHLDEVIPLILAILFISINLQHDSKILELIVVSATSFYFSFLLRHIYKSSFLFYAFLLIGIFYISVPSLEFGRKEIGKLILLIPFMMYSLKYLGKDKIKKH